MMRDKEIRHQHPIRWQYRFWTAQEVFDLYRDQRDARPDDVLLAAATVMARKLNALDRRTRHHNHKFARHERPSGLWRSDADADGKEMD